MSEVHPCGRRTGRCCHGPNKHFLEDMCWVLCQKVGTQQWNTKTWSRSATPSRILAPCDPNQSNTCNSQFSTYCCKRKNFLLQPCLGGIKLYALFHYTGSIHLKLMKNTMTLTETQYTRPFQTYLILSSLIKMRWILWTIYNTVQQTTLCQVFRKYRSTGLQPSSLHVVSMAASHSVKGE